MIVAFRKELDEVSLHSYTYVYNVGSIFFQFPSIFSFHLFYSTHIIFTINI